MGQNDVKQRLDGLEGLRGVAALLVAYNHAGMISGDGAPLPELFNRAHLSVDLFFLLSGFVLARAYEHRMPAPMAFARLRYARLWGPIAVGMVLGAVNAAAIGKAPVAILIGTAVGVAMLPLYRFNFPLNPPAWSIFFELVANVAHALVLRWMSNRSLLLLAAGCATIVMAGVGTSGLEFVGTRDEFWLGVPRVFMSYALGIVLYRVNGDRLRLPRSLGALPILLFPLLIAAASAWLPTELEVLFTLCVGPLVLLGALSLGESRAARLVGAFSFPLYALHYPLQQLGKTMGLSWWEGLIASLLGAAAIGLAVDWRFRRALLPLAKRPLPVAAQPAA